MRASMWYYGWLCAHPGGEFPAWAFRHYEKDPPRSGAGRVCLKLVLYCGSTLTASAMTTLPPKEPPASRETTASGASNRHTPNGTQTRPAGA